ncbi:hypothetical protein K488DRAFT_56096 [Vararia minispora EC-137]|uniref:Uncharacterized protein n=1 Tax=Vararia minispora EC-137 TaxID=1314806 RepID=A0ACB8QCN8_9AGAM|nr:hypothetical protein K488DRAFT_56096 [Vararia minispora EC-137]
MSNYKQKYDADGFVIIPGLIKPELFTELENACAVVVARTRAGDWPHRRVVGKQFPPYGDADPDSWGVQHVMHPDLGQPAFAKYYTSPEMRAAARELLGCEDKHLQMELFNLLINPTSHEFALSWHRDDVKAAAGEEEERDALSVWHYGVQWNAALYEDSSLFVVPGSHRVPRTPVQREQSNTTKVPEDPMAMSGAIQVSLKPGETVFYNNNILHCATYSPKRKRATLHASMGDTRGGATRARNILQHGLTWMQEVKFWGTLDDEGRKMLDRLANMQNASSGMLEYSLDG